MPFHAETRVLPYTPEQVFDVVADIERYPEFLPWCVATRVRKREGNVVDADMVVGFKMLRERFTTRDVLERPSRIEVRYLDGPFHHLTNNWRFERRDDGTCLLHFDIDFEFRSKLLEKLMGGLFGEAVLRMVGAFEKRARALYG